MNGAGYAVLYGGVSISFALIARYIFDKIIPYRFISGYYFMRYAKITSIAAKLAFTAIIADLFYIIYRVAQPVGSLDDMRFICAVPEMLELMLLSAVIVVAFMAVAGRMGKKE